MANILLSSKSIEENWSTFKDEYENLCDKHVPTKTVHVGETRKPPWLNYNVVKKARKRKNTMWEKFEQSKLTCDRLLFDQANKKYNKAMVEAHIKHEKTLAESLKENPK